MFVRAETRKEDIIALIPFYKDGYGEATRLLCLEGEILEDGRTLRAVRRNLAMAYQVDLGAQKKVISRLLGRTLRLPFVLPGGRTFVPLRTRREATGSDATHGYLELKHIEGFSPAAEGVLEVRIGDGWTVPVYASENTVLRALHQARVAAEYMGGETTSPDPVEAAALELARKLQKLLTLLEDLKNRL